MVTDPQRPNTALADQAIAQGDYLKALEHLERIGTKNPAVEKKIQETLERLKRAAAREFSAGHWTAAEGAFEMMRDYERHLTPAKRAEIHLIVEEIQRCRRDESHHHLLQAALKAAAAGLHREAEELGYRAILSCDDPHLFGRMRQLLRHLPNPDGRLLYGFDSPHEIKHFIRCEGAAAVSLNQDPTRLRRGTSACLWLPPEPARILFIEVPSDWSGSRELTCWIYADDTPLSSLDVSIIQGSSRFFLRISSLRKGWSHERFPLAEFTPVGNPQWNKITHVAMSTPGPTPISIYLDEMRLL